MSVQELIECLKTFDPQMEVLIEYTDHTGWLYKSPITEDDVALGDGNTDSDDEINDTPKVIITFNE